MAAWLRSEVAQREGFGHGIEALKLNQRALVVARLCQVSMTFNKSTDDKLKMSGRLCLTYDMIISLMLRIGSFVLNLIRGHFLQS